MIYERIIYLVFGNMINFDKVGTMVSLKVWRETIVEMIKKNPVDRAVINELRDDFQ
jgi:hypothetical protein